MVVRLVDAVTPSCGSKAGALGTLLRAGLAVPDGFVLPFAVRGVPGSDLRRLVARGLEVIGDAPVAVRSSASGEDGVRASAAGQHASVLGVSGLDGVVEAVRTCWASLDAAGAVAYRSTSGREQRGSPTMAVIVQRHVDAEVSGVLFTPDRSAGPTRIEASWGLGTSVVGGTVTPDACLVAPDGAVTRTVGDKRTRLDREGTRVVTHDVAPIERGRSVLGDTMARRLSALGERAVSVLGRPLDIEWAVAEDRLWLLQARPVTAPLPPSAARPAVLETGGGSWTVLRGTPGSSGVVTGSARVVRGADDFGRVRPGDVLVCPWTDPAWTPLLRVVAGVVTETGGVLAHAAIVAREYGIPAVLGVPAVTASVQDGVTITVDGDAGTVAHQPAGPA